MKTRIMKLSDTEFVPQHWIPHFLWGGHWEGIQLTETGSFYSFESKPGMLQYCVYSTEQKAEEVLTGFVKMKQRHEMLS